MAEDWKKIKKILKQPCDLKDLGFFVVVQSTGPAFGLVKVWQEQFPYTTIVQMMLCSIIKWKLLLVCIGWNDIALNQLIVPASNNCKMLP